MIFPSERIPGKISTILSFLAGISTVGVGLFSENVPPYHGIFTGYVFLFAALFLISSFKIEQSPISFLISFMGIFILVSSIIFLPYLGLEIESNLKFLGFMKGTQE